MTSTPEKEEILAEGRFLRLVREGRWEYVQRVNSRGAVFVLAVTPAREIVLVEQYRVPLKKRSIELPAGLLGDEAAHRNEPPEHCALRELEEETGFRGSSTRLLTEGPVAAGLTSEMLYLVKIEGLVRSHAGGGVDGEDITTHVVPLDQAHEWLERKRTAGYAIGPRIYAGLYFANLRL